MRKRLLSTLVAMAIIIGMLPAMSFAEGASDYDNNWAKSEINYMKDKGILSGYPDGTFKPTNNMSKVEFYKVINGLFGFTKKADVKFSDVNPTDWYYSEVEKGLGANYIPAGKSLNPNENITRGEVAGIIGIVFDIKEDLAAANTFADSASIPKSQKGFIGGLKKNGYINGYPDGTFMAEGSITRAEVVKMLHDISGDIVNTAGNVSKDVKTNFVVNTPNVVLKDMTIAGNLYLTEGIGNGDVTLDNVVVKGELSIKGGGPNSIIIKNSKINTVSVDKASGLVRVVFENTTVEEVNTTKEVKIELTNGTKIKLVELDGKVEVIVEKGSAIVSIDAVSNEIVIDSKGTIESIKTTKAIKVNGKEVKANSEHKVVEGKATEIKPKPTTKPPTSNESTGGSGGGGGGGGGSVTPEPELPKIEVEFMNSVVYLGKTDHNPKCTKLNPSDAILTYVSNNPEIVTVDKVTGKMAGVGLGETTVTVTATRTGYKTITYTFKVTVIEEPFEEADIISVSAVNGMATVTFNKSTHIARERLTVTQAVYGEEPFEVQIGDISDRNEVYNLSIPKLGEEYVGESIITSVSIDGKEPVVAKAFIVEKEEDPTPITAIGGTITNDGLSVTIEKIEYNEDGFIPNDPDSTSIYPKGFGVYFKIENNSDKVYRKPRIRFRLESPQYEEELNGDGYSMHPVKDYSGYIYQGETFTGFYQYSFHRDISISEIEVSMPYSGNSNPEQAFGTWLGGTEG